MSYTASLQALDIYITYLHHSSFPRSETTSCLRGGRARGGFFHLRASNTPGLEVLEVPPRRSGCDGRGGGGFFPEARGVLVAERSIDNRTFCETEVVARLAALDQYIWRGGQAEHQSIDRDTSSCCEGLKQLGQTLYFVNPEVEFQDIVER